MKNAVQTGDLVTVTAPRTLSAGAGFLFGTLFLVAQSDAASGAQVVGAANGVFDIPKATGAVTGGVKLYWDNTNFVLTTTSSGNTHVGTAMRSQLSADPTARIRLGITA